MANSNWAGQGYDYTNFGSTEPRCRTCNHRKGMHFNKLGKQGYQPPVPCSGCKCVEYLPKDNLEYLEYMHGKTV